LQSIIPSAFVKTVTVNSTITASVTCTVSAAAACTGRRRRGIQEDDEQFVAPSEVVSIETSQLPELERESRNADPMYFNPYGFPYNFHHQQALQGAFNEPNDYHVPYLPSPYQKEEVAERQLYLITTTKTNWFGAYSLITSSPSCFDSAAKLPQCAA